MKKDEAEVIVSRYHSPNLDLQLDGTTSFFGRGNARLSISEKDGGCACSILTDDADWNAHTWDLRLDLLPDLARALSFFSECSSGGYTFEALWVGDKPEKNVDVSTDEMLQIVQRNQIGPKTRYIVRTA